MSVRIAGLILTCALSADSSRGVGGQNTTTPATETQSHPATASSQSPATPASPDVVEQSWQILRSGLRSKKFSQRMEAVKALSLLEGNHQAMRFALHALSDKNPQVRASAAATLGDLHATSTIPALRAALSDKDVSVMLASTHALYMLRDASAYDVYYAILMGDKKTKAGLIQGQLDRLKDPKQVAQMGFEEGLGFVPYGGMGWEAYRTIMKHDNAPVRAAAARFLALDSDPMSEDALVQTALADKNIIVRQAALDALAQRNDPKCAERLKQNLGEDNKYPVRYRTAATIIHLSSAGAKRQSSTPTAIPN